MILPISALTLLIANDRDVPNTVVIVSGIELVEIFKLVLSLPNISWTEQVFKAFVEVAGDEMWLLFGYNVLEVRVNIVIIRRLTATVMMVHFAVALLRRHFILHCL